jgi:hypothetical protein
VIGARNLNTQFFQLDCSISLFGQTGLQRTDLNELAERGPRAHQQLLIDFLRTWFAQQTQALWID